MEKNKKIRLIIFGSLLIVGFIVLAYSWQDLTHRKIVLRYIDGCTETYIDDNLSTPMCPLNINLLPNDTRVTRQPQLSVPNISIKI
jgi:hypothetical protein